MKIAIVTFLFVSIRFESGLSQVVLYKILKRNKINIFNAAQGWG
jgi:hypothetical protein